MDKTGPLYALHTAQPAVLTFASGDETASRAVTAPLTPLPKRPRGRPPKTSDERDDGNRRQALLSAAAKLFRSKGFSATTTRDIAAAVGMHSGSPFYHFKSKGELLFTVMEEGMRSAIARQKLVVQTLTAETSLPLNTEQKRDNQKAHQELLAVLVRNQLDILLGHDADFIPVMLYEWRSLNPRQRKQMTLIKDEYESVWMPVLMALHGAGRLGCEVKIARLLIFGALNWTAQWYDPGQAGQAGQDGQQGGVSLDELATAAVALFLNKEQL